MLTNVNTVILHQDELHLFVDDKITKYKAQRGRAFFYKKPKRFEVVGDKRIMKFDTKDRKFQVDGTTGKRLYKKGKKRTTTPDKNMLVTDLDIKEGFKFRNVPMNHRLKYLLIGKKAMKFNYLDKQGVFQVTFPPLTRKLLKDLHDKKFEDFEQK